MKASMGRLLRMEQHLVRVGPLEVLLPDFATEESVKQEADGLTSLVVVLGPAVLTLWHADDRLEHRDAFLQQLLQRLKPKRHQEKGFTLGGCRFEGFEGEAAAGFGEDSHVITGTADFFGDFVCLMRTLRGAPPQAGAIDGLIDSMVQGMIVRRQRTLPRERLAAWMARQRR
jgi:hypothetical protein